MLARPGTVPVARIVPPEVMSMAGEPALYHGGPSRRDDRVRTIQRDSAAPRGSASLFDELQGEQVNSHEFPTPGRKRWIR
jgi:hypothetical protein